MHRKYSKYAIAPSVCLLMITVACSPDTPAAPTPAPPPVSSVTTLKVSAPNPIAPGDGETLNVVTPTMQVSEATGQFVSKPFSYEFELQNASGSVVASSTVNSTSLTVSTSLAMDSVYRWRARAVDSGGVGPWSATRSFKTLSLPGCINGVLSDARTYFFYLINRRQGDPAADWVDVMRNSGIPAGYPPGVVPGGGAPYYGLSQQITGAGVYRGRLFLPTATRDALGYYSRYVDFLSGSGSSARWAWNEDGSAPAYAPRACP
jgi:hypothetical protein